MTKIFAQGDLLITKVEDVMARAMTPSKTIAPDSDGAVVLERGEVSGHRHAIYGGGATLFRDDALARDVPNGLYVGHLAVSSPVAVKHEEHAAINLEPGVYRISRQREATDDSATQMVAD